MINSSPDYTITKPGVRPLSRKRDKLRTYGRQATATPEPRSEPLAKRARTAYAIHDDDNKNVKPLDIVVAKDDAPTVVPIFKANPPPAKEDQENQPPSKPEPNVPAKRSILNYFKPVTTHLTPIKPAKTNTLPDAEPAEEKQVERKVQPPSRPKKRVLRIRSNQSIGSGDDECGNYGHHRANGG
ncbi:hypothetical protein ISF_06996 [Cordyceps fumosorosea ARSEF 2679]|uniref:Uncharacterized protein n=1 Tax=Cordyceps fumosorosea (strain ARSEF 2679) TaxID=1081104 RepID=A0A167QLS6_CORFA|nr:hypothetical protein ISF_06996 [Cordyceps fumosorosea ARSEF 2679]OAA57755.1 hypothetical protein ISF_06996 [Cordyceps fumosorosea ARSEF 2679]